MDEVFSLFESNKLGNYTLPIPKELYKLANFILLNGKTKANIFLTSGNLSSSRQIREKIDTNQPLNPLEDDVYTVAFVLLDFLQSLLSPILPITILNSVVKLYESKGHVDSSVVQKIITELPKENQHAFVYLVSFFREMLACSEKNKLTPEKVSEIICECLIGEDKMIKSKHQFIKENLQMRADDPLF